MSEKGSDTKWETKARLDLNPRKLALRQLSAQNSSRMDIWLLVQPRSS